jgi:hypothetical protein
MKLPEFRNGLKLHFPLRLLFSFYSSTLACLVVTNCYKNIRRHGDAGRTEISDWTEFHMQSGEVDGGFWCSKLLLG